MIVRPRVPVVDAVETEQLLARLARVRATYSPERGFLLDRPQPRLPNAARRRYASAPGAQHSRKQ
jgi:hypothetical protein